MEQTSSSGVKSPENPMDFSFGFDDVNFSDRILLIEIVGDAAESEPDQDESRCHWARNVKQRRHDLPDDAYASPHFRMKTIHINSLVLAAKSPFFRKLFSNGMRESEQRHVTLRIEASEEVSFMDLLSYMYGDNLPRTTVSALLDLLVIADKFEVPSCLRYCSRLLHTFPMTCESALLYLNLPSTLLMSDTVQPIIHAAKQFLAAHYKDVIRFKEEVLSLPLAGIQAVLSSDDLLMHTENDVYNLVLKWARRNYPNLEERREIIRTHLLGLIRFPFMTPAKLKGVLTCTDIDPELASKIVFDALFFKVETPHRQRCLAAEKGDAASCQFVERAYRRQPVKVIEFELSTQQCTVYFDLKREGVKHLFPDGHIFLEPFQFGGQELTLCDRCIPDRHNSAHLFELVLVVQVAGSAACTVEYEVALREKPSEEFVSEWTGSVKPVGRQWSMKELFDVAWSDFVADDSPYFINGILYLRADLRVEK